MRSPRKWISGLIIAAVLGLISWIWSRQAVRPPSAVTPVAQLTLPVPQRPASLAMPSVEVARKIDHSGEIEVCGVGKVRIDPDDWTATGKVLDALTRKSRIRWLAALRNSDDYRARAAGLYLEGVLDRDEPRKDPDAARDELVQLALVTKDPGIFALANIRCIKAAEDPALGACPQLSLDAWARADSDNAVPWLQLAAKARNENNSSAEAAAFAHAAQAHHYESYSWSLFSFAQSEMPGDATAADRWFLTSDLIGVQAAMPMPFQPLSQYCSREAMSDATVHEQCNAVADLLVNKTKTLLELSMGKSLGVRLGWPAEITDKLTQQLHASMQALAQTGPSDPEQQWSCDSVARGNAFMSEWDRLGERALAAESIEQSGETVAELSRKFTELMEKASREAAAGAQRQSAVAQP
jgi:hypothetical protein